jgi:hypothetical protein
MWADSADTEQISVADSCKRAINRFVTGREFLDQLKRLSASQGGLYDVQ